MRIAARTLHAEILRVLTASGVSAEQASATARHMVWCESVGRHNFGIERIPIHLKRIRAGVLNPSAETSIDQLTPAIARLDGGGGFGYHAAERAMAHAITMAKSIGIGAVGVRNSNFFGAGAYYVNQAADASMIGIALSNSFPKVVAHGGLKPVLGTNPFAFGAPRHNGDHLLFDMATAALAGSTVRAHIEEGKPLPEGLAIDAQGKPITDPRKVGDGALLPFGGPKGFGLSLMVEILAGVITGSGVGDGVASMYNDFSRNGDNGHFLLALDISRFMVMEEYHARFDGFVTLLRSSGEGVLLPGEVRWKNWRDSQALGVEVDDAKWTALQQVS
jgi:ureidoglycolate dehydrogenase (NAD+)